MLGTDSVYRAKVCEFTWGMGGSRRWEPGIGLGLSIASWSGFRGAEIPDSSISIVPSFHSKIIIPLRSIGKGTPNYYHSTVLNLFAEGRGGDNGFLIYGCGIDLHQKQLYLGLEAGYLSLDNKYNTQESFYFGASIGIGICMGNTGKKTEEYLPKKLARHLIFTMRAKRDTYSPGETIDIKISAFNFASRGCPAGIVLWDGNLSNYIKEREFYMPSISGEKKRSFSRTVRLKEKIPRGHYKLTIAAGKCFKPLTVFIEGYEVEKREDKFVRENGAYEKEKQINLQWPTGSHQISSDYGWRNIWLRRQFHKGIDIPVPVGTHIMAAADGKVTFSGWRGGGYGYGIWIKHNKSFKTFYGHLSRCSVSKGAWVRAGERIGYSGETGKTTGPHLHFGVMKNGKFVDPELYLP